MKIKLVHCISSLKRGGAEEVVCSLIEELTEQYDQIVLYFHDGPHRERLESQGIHCIQIKGLLTSFDPIAFWKFFKTISHLKPQVIHSALWLANLFSRITGKLLGIKTVNSLHNTITHDHDGLIRIMIDKLTLTLADTIIAVTPAVAASAPYVVQKKITVIPNGVNVKKLASCKQVTRENLGLTTTHYIIGTVGRFVPVKNYPLLINCFAKLHINYPNTCLVVVGSGPMEAELRAQVQELKLSTSVHFVIGQPAQEYYSLFDCFVQPSKNEGLSIALLEALYFSLPVIVTDKNLKHAVISNKQNGLVIKPDNFQELYSALEYMMLNKEESIILRTAGKMLVQTNYSLKNMAKQYRFFFKNCNN